MNSVVIYPNSVKVNGNQISTENSGMEMLVSLYKSHQFAYPKFYKMDSLCRLGFIASNFLFDKPDPNSNAFVVIGHGGSIVDDRKYQQTIEDTNEYFPSPAIFVYTLANIVTGEVAIKHKLYGETSSFIIDRYDPALITDLLLTAFSDPEIQQVSGGWIDCENDNDFSVRFVTINRATPKNEIIDFFKNN